MDRVGNMPKALPSKEDCIGFLECGNRINVIDPSYTEGESPILHYLRDVKIKSGRYSCFVKEWDSSPIKYPYHTVLSITMVYSPTPAMTPYNTKDLKGFKKIGVIGSESGLVGFFNEFPSFSDEEWDNLCKETQVGCGWLLYNGFFSDCLHGNGFFYPLYTVYGRPTSNGSKTYDALRIDYEADAREANILIL